jgi:CheY-like chemotaxis protein
MIRQNPSVSVREVEVEVEVEVERAPAKQDSILPGAILALTGDPAAQDQLMELALEWGYGLCCRAAGSEAMRILTAEPPQELVVDLEAPGARELLRAVRANPKWRDIPILALTATNNPMIGVTVDAPIFFMPEMTGLEQALASSLQGRGPSS